jgi:hypothetical protein
LLQLPRPRIFHERIAKKNPRDGRRVITIHARAPLHAHQECFEYFRILIFARPRKNKDAVFRQCSSPGFSGFSANTISTSLRGRVR